MRLAAMLRLATAVALAVTMVASGPIKAQQDPDTVLKPADIQKLLPASVLYRGQSADGYYALATLVDTSGYSSDVPSKYQASFITEIPIKVGGHKLSVGVYGAGFVAGNKFVVTDVGAHDVLTVATSDDAALKRPMPLQVKADPAGGYRLYAGRRYVVFSR